MSGQEGWNRMQVIGLVRVNDRANDSLTGGPGFNMIFSVAARLQKITCKAAEVIMRKR